ncbi:MAG: hypothetical protein HPY53_01520 [Brevinematales bacterium]|nr:hypothetical protein [Brevinematales bacterium]
MKKVFGRLGKQYLKYLAEKLGFIEYEVGYNPSGIACSGDLRLMGMWGKDNGVHIFFNADHVCPWVTYRTIKSLKDYSGGVNQQMSFNELFNLEYIMYLFIGIRKPKYACNSRIVKARNAEYLFEIV